METFYSNGKLLITGEYLVLDGAKALALPTTFGQSLSVNPIDEPLIIWESLSDNNSIWFETRFGYDSDNKLINEDAGDFEKRLHDILKTAQRFKPEFLSHRKGYKVRTRLDFPLEWGLGSSSSLINNIASWAKIDAYDLLEETFGGSGYDIACAQNNYPLIYQLTPEGRSVNQVSFQPEFKEHLYFVYLNKKQDSREAIKEYNQAAVSDRAIISEIDALTEAVIDCGTLSDFCKLIDKHEAIMSHCLNKVPVKKSLFPDFNGSIKSLGAWGGDFILAASQVNPVAYFKEKGYDTILDYRTMILK